MVDNVSILLYIFKVLYYFKVVIVMNSNNSLLVRALKLNAAFSGISAILLIAAGGWVAVQLGLPSALNVYVVAGFLLLFSLQLWNIVRTRTIRTWEIASIIVGDLAWVIASLVLVALYYRSLTTTGLVLVDIVALAVLIFAIMQIRGLREYRRAASC